MLTDSKMIDGFGALAQPTRMAMFHTLRGAGAEGMPAGELAEMLSVPPPTLSFHLKEMTSAGVLLSRRDGRKVIYSVNETAVRELVTFLVDGISADISERSAAE